MLLVRTPVPRRLTCTPSHSDLYAKVQYSPYLQLSFRSVRLHEQTCNFGGLMFALVALVSPMLAGLPILLLELEMPHGYKHSRGG